MLQTCFAGECPTACQLLVAGVGHERASVLGFVDDRRVDGRVILHRRDLPRFGTVGDESVREKHYRRHVLHGDTTGLECVVEAVARHRGGDDRYRAFSVAAVEGLLKVALLGLGRKTRRGAAALYVHDYQRKLGHHGQTQCLALERKTGTRRGRHGEVTGERSTDGRTDTRDFVFGLYGFHTEVLTFGEFLENDGSRSDGVRTAEEGQTALLGCGAKTPCRCDVTADRPVSAFLHLARCDGICIGELMRVGGIVVTGVDSAFVGFGYSRIFLRKF